MPFRPEVGDVIAIAGVSYTFTPHPVAPGVPYGQTGRRATIYQLRAAGKLWALKVFTQAYIMPRIAEGMVRLRPYATLPGLGVCARIVLTPDRCPDLLAQHPELHFAVLMPWVPGETWQEVIALRNELEPTQCRALAASFARTLSEMEARSIAHCDLSGPNVLIRLERPAIALVDVEELYSPTLTRPDRLPAGSAGYAHRVAAAGLWQPDADRFAATVLLAEMLAWFDERVREASDEEQYFAPEELQQDTPRARLLRGVLRDQWGDGVAALFDRAWSSDTLQGCPTALEWLMALNYAGPLSGESSGTDTPSWMGAGVAPPSQPGRQESAVSVTASVAEPRRAVVPGYVITAVIGSAIVAILIILIVFLN
jgi:tRNA A-37 threonylcarbamoyl transferase component Bud32